GELDVDALRSLWPAVVDAVREGNSMLAAALAEARPLAVADCEALLALPAGATFSKRMAESDEHRRVVAEALGALAGVPLRPRYELRDVDGLEPAPAAPAAPSSGEELVARFMEEFDATDEELVDDEEGA
ncbi:MAG: hypothetical protein WBC33_09930, partial [Conexibacter sp.]